jgi:tetratricopeptide (TPR) repeat protein
VAYINRGVAYLSIWEKDKDPEVFENAFADLRKSLELRLSPANRKDAVKYLGRMYNFIAEQFVLEEEPDLAMTTYDEALKLDLDPKSRIEFENAKSKLADPT